MIRRLLLGLASLAFAPAVQAACGAEPGACATDAGTYHIALPDDPTQALPAVMFLHGYGGSGEGVLRMTAMVAALKARGYAVIAPSAERRGTNGKRSWAFYPGWPGRDEAAFLAGVLNQASDRFGVVPGRTILAGFSAGGFMVNYLACASPDAFVAYAPVSGGFWRPQPDSCAGPVRLFHTHGWRDTVVPIEGRYLGGGQFQQGDIFAGLEVWRGANDCADQRPDAFGETGSFWRRKWTKCNPDSALELALFPGGHQVPKGWSDMVVDWFEGLPPS